MKLNRIAMTVLVLLMTVPAVAGAQVPGEIPIQGFLTDEAGVPIDGETSIAFTIYDGKEGGELLHEEQASVEADAGAFTAYLTPDHEIFRASTELYLGVAIEGGEEMAPRLKIATVPYAAVAGNASMLQGKTADDFAPSNFQPSWEDIEGVPEDVADGDDGETYTAGSGVEIDGSNRISLNSSCSSGQLLKWDGTQWACQEDEDVEYLAGDGLTLVSNQFEIDYSAVQRRISGACASGEYVMEIQQDGTVICGADADTTYTAGSGLTDAGNTFSIDTSAVQSRVSGTCASNEKVLAINLDGSVVCGADLDTDTTYTAGSGLTDVGNTFSIDTSAVQSRVSGTCASNEKVLAINLDGSVVCGADLDTDTTYGAGQGLALDGNGIFSVADGGITSGKIADGAITNDDIAAGATIAADKVSGTAATLTGDQGFGGRVSADGFELSSSTTSYEMLQAADFQELYGGTLNDDWRLGGYGRGMVTGGTAAYQAVLMAPLDIPNGASVSEFKCFYTDSSKSGSIDLDFLLSATRVEEGTSSSHIDIGTVSVSGSLTQNDITQAAVDGSITSHTVDNSRYQYHVKGAFMPSIDSSSLQFLGCRVAYTYDELGH